MKTLVNQVQLIGNLGEAPVLKTFDNGNSLARFSMATSEAYNNNAGERVNETQWHKIVAWGKLANMVVEKFKKGDKVQLNGKITTRSYENNGAKKYITEIVVRYISPFTEMVEPENESMAKTEDLPF